MVGHSSLVLSLVAALVATTAALTPVIAGEELLHTEELVVSGDITPGGTLTLEVHADPGEFVLLAYGLGFLTSPVTLQGRDFHLDTNLPWFLLGLTSVPPSGALHLPVPIPNDPLLLGAQIHLHAAAPKLSNVVTLAFHEPAVVSTPAAAGDGYGGQVLVDFLDADAFGDVIIGGATGNGGDGRVWITFGPSTSPSLVLDDPTPQDGGLFGVALAAGDLLGSSDRDLAIAALGAGPGLDADNTGEVWIFEGPDFVNATLLTSPSPQVGGGFGHQLRTGDFDGDGDTDLAVGESGATVAGQALAGKVHVFDGPGLTLSQTFTKPGTEPLAGALFGAALGAGDIDGDGRTDLAVGAPAAVIGGQPQVGEGWIFQGPFTAPPVRLLDVHPTAGAAFACRVELLDLIGDDKLDFVSGIPGGQGTAPNPNLVRIGEVQVFDGADLATVMVFDDPHPEELGHFGFEINAGDLDGDGSNELLVGANLATLVGLPNAGSVFVYEGPELVKRLELTAPVPSTGAQFGTFLNAIDIDGDGRDELIIAAPSDDTGAPGAGSITIIDL